MRHIKTFLVLATILLSTGSLYAQPTDNRGWYQREDIQHVDIGWIKVLQFKEPAKPFAQHGWSYSAKQMAIGQQFATWLQQSYLPKGFLGEMKLSVLAPEPGFSPDSKDYTYNEAEKNNRKALPNTYGAYAKLYMHLKKTKERPFWPIDGLADYDTWYIMANNVELISQQIVSLSSPTGYYCLMPQYTSGMPGEHGTTLNEQAANYRNFTNSPQLAHLRHYMIPSKQISYVGGHLYTIILTKDNHPLPFDQVKVGELLDRFDVQLPTMYKIAINNGTKTANLLENAQRGLRLLRDMYKNELNEYVYTTHSQIDILSLSGVEPNKPPYWLQTKPTQPQQDVYRFPLLKLRKGVKEASINNDPLWIVCRLDKGGLAGNEGEIHKMESFIQAFNYDYVYNYFFGKDKVIQPYKPLPMAGTATATITSTPAGKSTAAKAKSSDPAVVFYEDFSDVATDATPASWTTQRSEITGNPVAVVEIKDASGKWLKLKRKAAPKSFTQPVSGDLEFSFDLLVQKGDVPWGTPGIDTQLTFTSAQGDKKIGMNVSPGDMNRADAAGWVTLNLTAPNCKIGSYYSIPDFTGSKPVNKVTMSFRKQGESMTILCNGNKVYDCASVFTAGMNLKAFHFDVNEKNVFHLSNVQVKKL